MEIDDFSDGIEENRDVTQEKAFPEAMGCSGESVPDKKPVGKGYQEVNRK